MAKWQSKAEIEEQQYRQWYKQVFPELKQVIDEYIASYDWEKPIEDESMKTLEGFPVALLRRRLAKDVVAPFVQKFSSASIMFRNRAKTEAIETVTKPLSDIAAAKARAEQKAMREALKTRPVAVEGMYSQSSTVGRFVMFPKENRVLLCISSEYIPADEDMDQFDSGYYEKFAEPTEEEKQSPEYQRLLNQMQGDLAYEARQRFKIEARRQAELDAIRASGREPSFLDGFFAGTSDN